MGTLGVLSGTAQDRTAGMGTPSDSDRARVRCRVLSGSQLRRWHAAGEFSRRPAPPRPSPPAHAHARTHSHTHARTHTRTQRTHARTHARARPTPAIFAHPRIASHRRSCRRFPQQVDQLLGTTRLMFLGDADAFDALVYLMFNSTLRSERVLCCACACVRARASASSSVSSGAAQRSMMRCD